jgi:TnpA family transposase
MPPKRRNANRLGFAIQLCYLRHPGRTLAAGDTPPALMRSIL